MNDLIIACMSANTMREVDNLVEINIDALEKYPALRVFPRNAYKRINNLSKQKMINTELKYKN